MTMQNQYTEGSNTSKKADRAASHAEHLVLVRAAPFLVR